MFYTSAHVQECKDRRNKWRGVLKYKDPNTGTWKEKKTTFKEATFKGEAVYELGKWRREMEAQAIRKKALYPVIKKTVSATIAEYLNAQYSLNNISVVTFQNRKRINEKVIAPHIGNMIFDEVTQYDIQNFIDNLSVQYAPASVRVFFAVISRTYKEALRREMIDHDPTDRVILPKIARKQVNYLDEGGRADFLSKIGTNSNYYLPAMIAYYTGMRAGEICGLQWRDVKLDRGIICIRQTAVFREGPNGGDVIISFPKTPSSRRNIPILDQLKPILKLELASKPHDKDDFVIQQHNPKLLCAGFLKWSTRNGVYGAASTPISLHGLRHTFATVGVQSGMDIKSLSSLLGHASAKMTLDTYASEDETAKRVAMETLSEFLQMERAAEAGF